MKIVLVLGAFLVIGPSALAGGSGFNMPCRATDTVAIEKCRPSKYHDGAPRGVLLKCEYIDGDSEPVVVSPGSITLACANGEEYPLTALRALQDHFEQIGVRFIVKYDDSNTIKYSLDLTIENGQFIK